jgi:hypothetical protein
MEHIAEIGIAALVVKEAFSLVRSRMGKTNGHSEVRPRDAVEFWTLQKGIETKVDSIDRKVDRLLDRERAG